MEFNEEFLGAEELKAIQKIEFEILCKFADICDKHEFRYFLDAGTLLGAVRHKGFIPWDDDIDVGMPRKDYDEFIKIGQRELGELYFLQTKETDPKAPFSFAKVRKQGTEFIEWNKRHIKMNHGIFIDVFPYDLLPESESQSYIKKCRRLNKIFFYKMIPDRAARPKKSLKWVTGAVVKRIIYYLLKFTSTKKLKSEMDKWFAKYKDTENPNGVFRCHSFFEDVEFPYSMLFPQAKVEFCGRFFCAPKD